MEMEMISCPLTVFVEKKWMELSSKHINICASAAFIVSSFL